jgi:LmbE family N-acetylglucosaminyl deacetylase
MEVFGIENYTLLDFETRKFDRQRQHILDWMCAEGESFKPDLVLCSAYGDCHQDHIIVRDEAVRAYRRSSILGYELPWSNPAGFFPRFYVPLEQEHLNIKLKALAKYKSQWGKRHYMETEIVQATTLMRGQQIDHRYAEAFEVMRWIWNE